jgi:hypothetical protein
LIGGEDAYDTGGSGGYVDTSESFTYDGPGDVTGELQAMSDRESAVLSQGWNADGTRATLGVNLGGTLSSDGSASDGTSDLLNNYTYNFIGEMTAVQQVGQSGGNSVAPKFSAIGYDIGGRMTSVDTYNASSADSGSQVTGLAISYDHESRPTDLTYTAQDSILAGYHYGYDSDGTYRTSIPSATRPTPRTRRAVTRPGRRRPTFTTATSNSASGTAASVAAAAAAIPSLTPIGPTRRQPTAASRTMPTAIATAPAPRSPPATA